MQCLDFYSRLDYTKGNEDAMEMDVKGDLMNRYLEKFIKFKEEQSLEQYLHEHDGIRMMTGEITQTVKKDLAHKLLHFVEEEFADAEKEQGEPSREVLSEQNEYDETI